MIEYDYLLERDQADERVIYTPTYPKAVANLASIEGPNGSGKSTLLHLVALGCHGLKTGVVNESLRTKIRGLLDDRLQSLSFEFTISDEDNKPVLTAKKTSVSQDIELRGADGKLLTSEQFDKRYKLIYDIPEDPLRRLEQLLFEIQATQMRMATRVRGLRDACLRVQADIEDARDPQKIVQRQEEIRGVERRKAQSQALLQGQRDNLQQVTLFTSLKFYEHWLQREKDLAADIRSLKKDDTKKKKIKKDKDDQYTKLGLIIAQRAHEIEDSYHTVTPFLEGMFATGAEKAHYELWREIVVKEELLAPDLKKTLLRESMHFKSVLREQLEGLSGSGNLEEARLLTELLDLLGRYRNSAVEIPGAGLSVQRFSDVLSAQLQKHQDTLAREKSIREAMSQLDAILAGREQFVDDLLPKWRAIEECVDSEDEADSPSYVDPEALEARRKDAQRRVDYYKSELTKLGVEAEEARSLYSSVVLGGACPEYAPLSENDLRDRIAGLQASIDQLTGQVHRDTANLGYLQEDLEKLMKREPHKYQDRVEALKTILADVQRMGARLNQYEEYIQALIKKKADPALVDSVRDEYYEHVFEYLGRRVGKIRHVSETYEVAKIDLLRREIISTEGKQLQVEWLSTGEGQSAYLTGLLSGYDGRKMIALFDEVAMMDAASLAAVKDRLVELYATGRLIVGVIVQKGEDCRVEELT